MAAALRYFMVHFWTGVVQILINNRGNPADAGRRAYRHVEIDGEKLKKEYLDRSSFEPEKIINDSLEEFN